MQKHAPCHAALNNETKYLLSKKLQNSGTGTHGQKSKKCSQSFSITGNTENFYLIKTSFIICNMNQES